MMFWLFVLLPRAIANEIGPILPKYIVNIIMILPKSVRLDVRFLERPTVAEALKVSYITSSAEASVTAIVRIVDAMQIVANATTTATAFFTESSDMRLSNSVVLLLFVIVAKAEQNKTVMVTVLMPPAVPTGEPPMSISIREVADAAFVRFSWGTEAKPAVLVVMDWNRET